MQLLPVHHDALRLRFMREDIGWQSALSAPDELIPLTWLDLSVPPQEQEAAIVDVANQLQASLDLSKGPLLRVAYFDLGADQPSRLLLVMHHLVIDGVSWRILIEDLQIAYQQLSQGEALQLPAKTSSFKLWSEKLQEYAQSSTLHSELDYWLTTLRQSVERLPVDYPGGENTEAVAYTVAIALSVEETQALLQDVSVAYRTQINDVLLTALVKTFSQWTGQSSLLIDLEGHGREELFEDVDLSRTVGWFTSMFPVLLSLGDATNPEEALLVVKEQLLGISNRGIGYGVLRYLSGDREIAEMMRSIPKPEVIFNYLGQFDQLLSESSLFGLARERSGAERSGLASRTHLLAVNGSISRGRLQMNWTYSEKLHRRTTIEELAQGFVEALRLLIAQCQSPDVGRLTPKDFPLVQLSQEELNQALDKISF
jgi:non-ribosomal peptide synthase protein (TIGR01720 family)